MPRTFGIRVMLIIDNLIIAGVRFVLDKVVAAVETEMNDDSVLRERLLDAQMRVELGEMSQEEFDVFEDDILARIREIKERQRGGESAAISPKDMKVTGIEASFEGDEH
jgi:gas vesicle protein GvpG